MRWRLRQPQTTYRSARKYEVLLTFGDATASNYGPEIAPIAVIRQQSITALLTKGKGIHQKVRGLVYDFLRNENTVISDPTYLLVP